MSLCGREPYQKGTKPAVAKPIRNDAQDRNCTLSIPGVCCGDPARTVGCHMRLFGMAGGAQKPDDIFILDACDRCHSIFDSRDKWAASGVGFDDVLRAFMQTLRNRRASGLITLEGEQ